MEEEKLKVESSHSFMSLFTHQLTNSNPTFSQGEEKSAEFLHVLKCCGGADGHNGNEYCMGPCMGTRYLTDVSLTSYYLPLARPGYFQSHCLISSIHTSALLVHMSCCVRRAPMCPQS